MRNATILPRLVVAAVVAVAVFAPARAALSTSSPDTTKSLSTSHASRVTYFYEFGAGFKVRPFGPIDVSGTGSWLIGKLHWRNWSAMHALATGRFYTNVCKPDCAAGHFTATPATITFYGVAQCHGKAVFTNVRVATPGSKTPYTASFRTLGYLSDCSDSHPAAPPRTSLRARNLLATPSVKASLRSAFLANRPPSIRGAIRGPLPGTTYYGLYGTARYALATFSTPPLGTQDQPEAFAQPVGQSWRDLGDTGGCLSKIPAPLLRIWHLPVC